MNSMELKLNLPKNKVAVFEKENGENGFKLNSHCKNLMRVDENRHLTLLKKER